MFDTYYQQQLSNLRARAAEFAKAHPAIAPMLGEVSADPDVERLLEGTAFLCGILQQKIDDDFPEIVHSLTEISFPHLLRPLPSASVVVFTPKDALLETLTVPAGTMLGSIPVQGTSCSFTTIMDVAIAPLTVESVSSRKVSTTEEVITAGMRLRGMTLDQWNCDQLCFYLAGDYHDASNLFMRLRTAVRSIRLKPRGGKGAPIVLSPDHLRAPGLEQNLFAMPDQSPRGFGLLTEYFLFSEKFLFLNISGMNALRAFGKAAEFEIEFSLEAQRTPVVARKEHFTLYATPVINVFRHDADPVEVNHEAELLPLSPSGARDAYSIYSVEGVTGFVQGTLDRREYAPFSKLWLRGQRETGVFQVHRSPSVAGGGHDVHLSLSYSPGQPIRRETLSVELTCTNGHLAEQLRPGDICMPTSNSPELATFRNIIAPTPQIDVAIEQNALWRLLSHLTLNLLPGISAESFRELLRMYTFETQRSDRRVAANVKRVNALEDLSVEPVDRIVRGVMMRGTRVRVAAAAGEFAGPGDLYLFGSVLDTFIAQYASMNVFTLFEIHNPRTGEILQWPPRIGAKRLI